MRVKPKEIIETFKRNGSVCETGRTLGINLKTPYQVVALMLGD